MLILYLQYCVSYFTVGDVSTEELVAAYHAACALNQVKPSPTIIQQLQVSLRFLGDL